MGITSNLIGLFNILCQELEGNFGKRKYEGGLAY